MTDADGGFFGDLGRAARPVKGALDFLAPPVAGPGQGLSLGSLMKAAGRGAKAVVSEGPGALLGAGVAALNPDSGMSARDRLLMGGIAVGGGALMAREAHRAWKASVGPGVTSMAMPSGADVLQQFGNPQRFQPHLSPTGMLAKQRWPGLPARQAEILGAFDTDGVMRGIRRWDESDVAADAHGKKLFGQYSQMVGSSEAAQLDWARFDYAMDRGLFKGNRNAKLRKLWNTAVTSPQDLKPDQVNELFLTVRSVNEATQAAGNDLSFGVVGRVTQIEMSPDGPIVFTRVPDNWEPGSSVVEEVREYRFKQFNYRNLADRGKELLRDLYQRGMADWERVQNGEVGRLPGKLEVGPRWYPQARDDVADVFGLARTDSDELQRAVAAVSFLSEAEDWSTNIVKAHRVMTDRKVTSALDDDEFLAYLRDPKSYTGKKAAKFQGQVEEIHQYLTDSGFKVYETDTRIILRLTGGAETVMDIFASTERRKQRNFFLNIYHPEYEYPVTIDRHAFDAFMGIDSGLSKRPIDQAVYDGEEVYDVIADTYRSLARELGISPHELQAVVWETWRILKEDSYINDAGKRVGRKGGWDVNDPYMMPEPGTGAPNQIYEALNGRGLIELERPSPMMPAEVLRAETDGLGAAALPDGSVVYMGHNGVKPSSHRHLYPAILGEDGVARWAQVRPTPVSSTQTVRSQLQASGYGESLMSLDWDKIGGHPAITPMEAVLVDLLDTDKLPRGRGWQVEEIGRVAVDEPEFEIKTLRPEEMDPKEFMDPERSPLKTTQFVGISAHRSGVSPEDNLKATRKLEADLKRRGYHPVEAEGRYTMDDGEISEEASFFVWGVDVDEAAELGAKYGQESVLLPQGLLYTDGSGQFRPNDGLTFGQPPEGSDRTLIKIGDREVTFSYDFDWGSDPLPFVPALVEGLTTRQRRRVAIKLAEGSSQRIDAVADELQGKGYSRGMRVYSSRQDLDETWRQVSESLYSDGIETYSVLSETAPSVAPNAGMAYVPGDRFLPDEPVRAAPTTGAPELRDGDAVIAPDEFDIMPALEERARMWEAGEGPKELRVGKSKYKFPGEVNTRREHWVTLKNGLKISHVRRDSPLTDNWRFEERWAIEFDPRFRVGNTIEQLDDGVIAELEDVTAAFMDRFGDAVRRFRVTKIAVSPGLDDAFAQVGWGSAGQPIVLSRSYWSDIPKLMTDLKYDREVGFLARGAEVSPGSILAHEFGHVIHGAIRSHEGWGKKSWFERQLQAEIKKRYKGRWSKHAIEQISETAGTEMSELLAEAFSEVMYGTPSDLSRLVVDFTERFLDDALKYRKVDFS